MEIVDYAVTPALKLGTDVIWVSSQWYIGDQANQNVKLADYWVANLHGSYQITSELQLYGYYRTINAQNLMTLSEHFSQPTASVLEYQEALDQVEEPNGLTDRPQNSFQRRALGTILL